MKPILVLACLCFIGSPTVNAVSKKVLDFATIYNGDFDNRNQTLDPGDDHDFILVTLKPVDIECFRPNPVLLVELDDNFSIRILALIVVTDGIEDTVKLTIYSFTDPAKHKSREYNAGNFSNVKCSDLENKPGCVASFRVVSKAGYAFGNFPHCGAKVNGEYPRYTCNHQCDSFSTTFPVGLQRAPPIEPFELVLTSRKYPLINPPQGYVSPCEN
ncbi:hypothetical protein BsWGS_23120 [Bradybaena similaris]